MNMRQFIFLCLFFIAVVLATLFVFHEVEVHQIEVCSDCLDRNAIPCEFGNCSEYKETVRDCCPQCWVDAEEGWGT